MKMEVKSSVILLSTLLLGVVLGMVGSGMLQRARSKQVGELRKPPGFVAHMSTVIQPSAEQHDTVNAILEATAAHNQRMIDSVQSALRHSMDSMRAELAPLLSEAQRDRLMTMARLPDPFRPPPGGNPPAEGRGPPPDGRGPPPDGRRPPPDGRGPPPA